MKVSIAVAIYNAEKYLDKCLESLMSQTYKEIEIILVNDGSNDNSLSVCEKYKSDNRIIVVDKLNGGLSSARQAGLNVATGEYICFIDPDDYLDSHYVELLLAGIERMNADICICGYNYEYKDVVKKYFVDSKMENPYVVDNKVIEKRYFELLSKYYMSDSWNKMYRKDFIIQSGVKFELPPKMNGSDLAFNHKLLMHGPKITFIEEALYNHVEIENSAVHRARKQLLTSYDTAFLQLVKEAQRLKLSQTFYVQLSTLYARFLRSALLDSIQEAKTKKEKIEHIEAAKLLYRERHKENTNIKLRYSSSASKSLNIFMICFLHSKFLTLQYIEAFIKGVNRSKGK